MEEIQQNIEQIKKEYIEAKTIEDVVEIIKKTIVIIDQMNKENNKREKEQDEIIIEDLLKLTSKKKALCFLVKNIINNSLREKIIKKYEISEEELIRIKQLESNLNDEKIGNEEDIHNIEMIAKKVNEMDENDFEIYLELEKGKQNEINICKAVINGLIEKKERAIQIQMNYQQTFTSLEVKKMTMSVSQMNTKVTTNALLKGSHIQMDMNSELRDMGISEHMETMMKWTKLKNYSLLFHSLSDTYDDLITSIKQKKNLFYIIQTDKNHVFGTFNNTSVSTYGDRIKNDSKHFMFSVINHQHTEPLKFKMKVKMVDSFSIDKKEDKIFISLGCCTIICPINDKENSSVGTIDPNFGEYYKDKKQFGPLIFVNVTTPQIFSVEKFIVLELK